MPAGNEDMLAGFSSLLCWKYGTLSCEASQVFVCMIR